MSWRYVQAILETDPSQFTLVEKAVALEIANIYDERPRFRRARISYEGLAHRARVHKRTAQEAVYALEGRQLLEIRRGRGPNATNDFIPLWRPAEKRGPGPSSQPESAVLDRPLEGKDDRGPSSQPESAVLDRPVPVRTRESVPIERPGAARLSPQPTPAKAQLAKNADAAIAWRGCCRDVPNATHQKFIRDPRHRDEHELFTWYRDVDARIQHGEIHPRSDNFKFWDEQHDADFPPTLAAMPRRETTADKAAARMRLLTGGGTA